MSGEFISIDGPTEGPLLDELRNRQAFTRAMTNLVYGLMIPVQALKNLNAIIEEFEVMGPDSTLGEVPDDAMFPVIDGVRPVAMLWKHRCSHVEDGVPDHSNWYLVPLLQPTHGDVDSIDDASMMTCMEATGEFLAALVGDMVAWQTYKETWGEVPQ
jgi:hypothetical protein